MSYFDGIKVGDRVWSVVYGWGVHTFVGTLHGYSIGVEFKTIHGGIRETYSHLGQVHEHELQTLFWDEVKITPPPKPKRMVKKEKEGWTKGPGFSNFWDTSYGIKDDPNFCRATLTWEEEE